MNTRTTSRICIKENIYLYCCKYENPIEFYYEVECACFKSLQLILDFSGSENFEVSSGGLIIVAVAPPYTRICVGTIKLRDQTKRGILRSDYSWKLIGVSEKFFTAQVLREKMDVADVAERTMQLGIDAKIQNRHDVENKCSMHHILFIDISFLPNENAISDDYKLQWVADGEFLSQFREDFTNFIVWRRPRYVM